MIISQILKVFIMFNNQKITIDFIIQTGIWLGVLNRPNLNYNGFQIPN